MKNVIVTGANGFLGSTLIERLIGDGTRVLAIDCSFENCHLPESELIRKLTIRLDQGEELLAIPKEDYDAFYHFAWRGVNGKEKADPMIQENNIRMNLICARAARELRCGRFLVAGTIAERVMDSVERLEKTTGGMMYAAGKNAAHLMLETWCKCHDQPFVWMQFANIYGPQNHTGNLVSYTLAQLRKDEDAEYGPALQPYDFIYIDDLLEAIYRMGDAKLTRSNYFIGSGDPRRLRDYLLTIGQLCGKEHLIKIGRRPDDGVMYDVEMFDISPLVADIGEYVRVPFEEGVRRTIEAG